MMISNATGGALTDLKSLLALAAEIADPKAVKATLAEISQAKADLDRRFAELEQRQREDANLKSELAEHALAAKDQRQEALEATANAVAAETAARSAQADLAAAKASLEADGATLRAQVEAFHALQRKTAEANKAERASILEEWRKVREMDLAVQADRDNLDAAVAAHEAKVAALKSAMA